MASLASPASLLPAAPLACHKTPPTSPSSSISSTSTSTSSTPISSPPHLPALARDVAAVHLFLQSLTSRSSLLPTPSPHPSSDTVFLQDLREALKAATAPLHALHSRYPERLTAAAASTTISTLAFSTAITPASHRSSSFSTFATPSISDSSLALHTPSPTAADAQLDSSSASSHNSAHAAVATRLHFTLSPSTAASPDTSTPTTDPFDLSTTTPARAMKVSTPSVPVSRLFRKILRTPASLADPSFTDSDDDEHEEDQTMQPQSNDGDVERLLSPVQARVNVNQASVALTGPSGAAAASPARAGDEREGGAELRSMTPPPSAARILVHFTTPPHPSHERERAALQQLEEVKREIREREKRARAVLSDDEREQQRGGRLDWEDCLIGLDAPAGAMGEAERRAFTDLLYDEDEDEPAQSTPSTCTPSPVLAGAGQRRRREEEGGAEGDGQGPSQRRVSPSTLRLTPDIVPLGLPPALPRRFSSPSSFSAPPKSIIPALDALVAARLAAPPSPSPFTVRGVGSSGGRSTAPQHISPTSAGVFAPSVFSTPFQPLAGHLNGSLPLPSPYAFSPAPASPSARSVYSQDCGASPATRQLASLYSTLDLSPEGRPALDAAHSTQPSSGKHLYNTAWHGDSC